MKDDAELIRRTLEGHSAAFGQLVAKYQDRLYNSLVHVVDNAEDAKDVVQETFVQAFLKLKSFHGNSAFYTWLYRIAFNQAATFRRRCRSMRSAEQGSFNDVRKPRAEEGPSRRLEQDERCGQVRQAIARLSDEHRAILVLREIDGFAYETIAEMLDLPVGTVRSRLFRARMQLREELKEVLTIEE